MIRCVYASKATVDFSPADLLDLLKQARAENDKHNITGILLYSRGTFFQVLEGEDKFVHETLERIKLDKRHKDYVLIEEKQIFERSFPYWSMGFDNVDINGLAKVEGFGDFLDKEVSPADFLAHKNVVGSLLAHLRSNLMKQVASESHDELPQEHADPFLRSLHGVLRVAVKVLAVLMVLVVILGVIDVLYVLYGKITTPPFLVLTIQDLLETFGAFLVVLIAIEIFLNITVYIRSDVFPVKLVVATALMAISRKIIVFDYKHLPYEYVSASALAVLGLSIAYWLVQKKP